MEAAAASFFCVLNYYVKKVSGRRDLAKSYSGPLLAVSDRGVYGTLSI